MRLRDKAGNNVTQGYIVFAILFTVLMIASMAGDLIKGIEASETRKAARAEQDAQRTREVIEAADRSYWAEKAARTEVRR